jgi:hypothetical protein
MLPKQAHGDFAMTVSLQPSIQGAHGEDEPLPARDRQGKRRKPEEALFDRRPKSMGCLRTNVDIGVEQPLDGI